MFFAKKPVLKQNLADEIFFGGFIYLPEFRFLPKTGFKTKHRQWNIFLGNIFIRRGLGFCEKPVLTKHRQRNKSHGDLFTVETLCFSRKTTA